MNGWSLWVVKICFEHLGQKPDDRRDGSLSVCVTSKERCSAGATCERYLFVKVVEGERSYSKSTMREVS